MNLEKWVMFKYHHDQAAGLRQIMLSGKPRAISILSASEKHNQSRLLTNLASSINRYGSHVLIVHACNEASQTSYAVDSIPALLDVAKGKTRLLNAIKSSDDGFAVAKLTHQDQLDAPLDLYEIQQLGFVFEELMQEFDFVLVDAALNQQDLLPLPILHDCEILIELSRHPQSIKQAYSLIKRICNKIGTRSFSIVVDDATDDQAEHIYNNIAAVAWQHLKVQLSFFGAIPTDLHLTRAAMLGRSVIDAFPTAMSAAAFQKIAQRLDYKVDLEEDAHHLQHASII
jgi:flagellar biosynthesis protein FlhG